MFVMWKTYVIDALQMYQMNNMTKLRLVSLLTELFEAYPIPLTPDAEL